MGIRVHQLAKELGISSKELIDHLKVLHVEVTGHMSSLDDGIAELVKYELDDTPIPTASPAAPVAPVVASAPAVASKEVEDSPASEGLPEVDIPEEISEEVKQDLPVLEIDLPTTVKDLAVKLHLKPNDIIKKLMGQGVFVTINQVIPDELTTAIAKEEGFQVHEPPTVEDEMFAAHLRGDPANEVTRAPVVTFMGHVDHGKTSLLDVIRKSSVTSKESGGMTQHIGAYEVLLDHGKVAFLDTPGHAAFTAMRARGANATDVVVLVVAADDGIMPQTIEAIDHARAAGVPIVVAINKCDLPGANIDRVKQQLTEHDLKPEDWGGTTITAPVSAKTGEGVDNLLELLLLESELLELKADPGLPASGSVVEAKLCKGKGAVATVLVKNGTLKIGDFMVAGLHWGRVKSLANDYGKNVRAAGPSTPVEVSGLNGIPQAGDEVYAVESEAVAKDISGKRQEKAKRSSMAPVKKISLDDLYDQIQAGRLKELNIILKADVQGSLEVLSDALQKLSTDEIRLVIIHQAIGDINESDVMLATASNALVIGFHVGLQTAAYATSKREGVQTKLYRIIYEAVDDIKQAMAGCLDPLIERVYKGTAEVLQVFKVTKVGIVAGSKVKDGVMLRGLPASVKRDGEIVYEGKVITLKRFKDDVREVKQGFECGITLDGFKDIAEGDMIETYEVKKTARTL